VSDALARFKSKLNDRYTLDRELGRGGMAAVYLAEDRRHGRQVAIKVLAPDLVKSVGAERFLREIGITARLSHPYILPLLDSCEVAGLLYYVMPYIAGDSLRARLERENRLPVTEAIRIAREVAAALGYAHRQGFVHRDVKPENILFQDGHAVVADFGIARAISAAAAGSATESGLALGTPAYMSPEQVAAEGSVDGRSDQYSLACVTFEMMAGEPPFRGTGARAVMLKHMTENPHPLRAFRPEVPLAVERAVARALCKEPNERFSTIGEFANALADSDYPSEAASVAFGPSRSIAVLPFVNASPDSENEYLSDGITDELIDALTQVEGLRVASRTSVFALKGTQQDVRAIGALLGVSAILEGTVRKAGERLRITARLTSVADGGHLWSERYDRNLGDVFAVQDEIAQTIVSTLRGTWLAELPDPARRRYTEDVEAYSLYLKGRYAWNKRTSEGVTEAIALFEQAIARDSRYALAYTGLADAFALHVDYRSVPVAEGFERAKVLARTALELDERLAEAHSSLAWCLFIYDWDFESAAAEFRRAIELDPGYASAHQWYAFLLAATGRVDEALIEGHTAQELDPASISIRRCLGWLYYYARRYERARYHAERAVAMNPGAEESYRVLGLSLALQGSLDEAEAAFRQGIVRAPVAYALAGLGYVLALRGDCADAESVVAELEARSRREYVSPAAIAMVHIGLGNLEAALDWMDRALEERRGWMVYLDANPMFDPLRDHPRFLELRTRVGLGRG
jgi:serine/threonine-protein kinase